MYFPHRHRRYSTDPSYIVDPPRRIVKIPRRQGRSELASQLAVSLRASSPPSDQAVFGFGTIHGPDCTTVQSHFSRIMRSKYTVRERGERERTSFKQAERGISTMHDPSYSLGFLPRCTSMVTLVGHLAPASALRNLDDAYGRG